MGSTAENHIFVFKIPPKPNGCSENAARAQSRAPIALLLFSSWFGLCARVRARSVVSFHTKVKSQQSEGFVALHVIALRVKSTLGIRP
jgi:hypothetical protein